MPLSCLRESVLSHLNFLAFARVYCHILIFKSKKLILAKNIFLSLTATEFKQDVS